MRLVDSISAFMRIRMVVVVGVVVFKIVGRNIRAPEHDPFM